MKDHVEGWKSLTSDPVILDAIKHYHIEFGEDLPFQICQPKQIHFSLSEREIINEEIAKLLNKGVVEQTHCVEGDFISTIFVRPKKDGTYRMILNLKTLNEFVSYYHFKMGNIKTALKLMRPGCFMASVDLKDAYYSVPNATEDRRYLKFEWQGSYFQYTCLPNGLACAPRLFTKILKPVYSHIRSLGHICMGHIDDSLLLGYNYSACTKNIQDTVDTFVKLGFVIHPETSVLVPSQEMEFLSFLLNSVNMTIRLPPTKAEQSLLHKSKMSIREVAQVIGLIVSSFPGVQFGELYYRNLEKDKILALHISKGDYDSPVYLSNESRSELTWWVNNVDSSFKPIVQEDPDLTLTTDASTRGWGTVFGVQKTGGLWSLEEQAFHINYLELKAVLLGLKSLLSNVHNKHIRIQSDNTTTVAYVDNMGGIKSAECNDMAQKIWLWCMEREIWLSACHIPGSTNVEADTESRQFNSSTEWSLNQDVFSDLDKLWVPFELDLFASRLNFKVSSYVSWKPDPGAKYVNAFFVSWKEYYFYAFPPFSVIAACLQKIEQDQATGVLLVPVWQTQPWFTPLLHLLVDNPVLLPHSRCLLTQPHNHALHPLRNQLKLMACKLSRESLQQRSVSDKATAIILKSWSDGTQKQYRPYIKQWIDFCSKWKADPYNPPLTAVLDFLVSLHDKGLTYTTINTARSAISAVAVPTNNMTIGSHPLVSRFMKGVYKASPPTPRYQSTWDLQPVLTYLSSLNPPEKLDLKSLTLKLVMLVALLSAQRGQSLHILDIGCMKELPNGFEFLLTEHVKQSRPGYRAPSVVLQAYPADSSLCVSTYLKEYLRRTKPLRGSESKLFISFTKPYKQVSRETISRWIRLVMELAGVDTKVFKPHSTRAAATSKAKAASVPLHEILRTAGWSSSRCFDQFYNKPVETSTFASAVLQID